jgi:hypothetical protein
MVQFEYKVHTVSGGKEFVSSGHADGGEFEEVMNRYAKDGWEYQNTISNQYVTDGERFLKPLHYLVFRRAKS